jgi:hypothetical protein
MANRDPTDEQWERILRGGGGIALAVRLNRRLFALIPSPWRCKSCNAPFKGPAAGTFRWIGYSPSAKNPSVCARCIERAPKGGAIVPVSVLMADVRGYTQLTEGLSPSEVPEAVNRFYETSSKALLSAEALLGQIEGDLVMGLFVPGLAGRESGAKRSKARPACCARSTGSESESASRPEKSSSGTSAAAASKTSRRSAMSPMSLPGSRHKPHPAKSSWTPTRIAPSQLPIRRRSDASWN